MPDQAFLWQKESLFSQQALETSGKPLLFELSFTTPIMVLVNYLFTYQLQKQCKPLALPLPLELDADYWSGLDRESQNRQDAHVGRQFWGVSIFCWFSSIAGWSAPACALARATCGPTPGPHASHLPQPFPPPVSRVVGVFLGFCFVLGASFGKRHWNRK